MALFLRLLTLALILALSAPGTAAAKGQDPALWSAQTDHGAIPVPQPDLTEGAAPPRPAPVPAGRRRPAAPPAVRRGHRRHRAAPFATGPPTA